MPSSPEHTAARHLVYQGLGRNVLQFQRLELLLKLLLGIHEGSYTAETMAEELKRNQKAQEKNTLGGLTSRWFQKVILTQDIPELMSEHQATFGKISHRFGVTITQGMHEEWERRLKALVKERNELVHLSLLEWDLDTVEGCNVVVAKLEVQLGRIKPEIEQLKHYHELFLQFMKQLSLEPEASEVESL